MRALVPNAEPRVRDQELAWLLRAAAGARTMIDSALLSELRRLLAEATPGEWLYDDGDIEHANGGAIAWIADHANVRTSRARGGELRRDADGLLIVALRNAADQLIAMAERAEELATENARLTEQVKTLRESLSALVTATDWTALAPLHDDVLSHVLEQTEKARAALAATEPKETTDGK